MVAGAPPAAGAATAEADPTFMSGKYLELLQQDLNEGEALDSLGLKRYCCRRMVLTHVDLIEKLLEYVLILKHPLLGMVRFSSSKEIQHSLYNNTFNFYCTYLILSLLDRVNGAARAGNLSACLGKTIDASQKTSKMSSKSVDKVLARNAIKSEIMKEECLEGILHRASFKEARGCEKIETREQGHGGYYGINDCNYKREGGEGILTSLEGIESEKIETREQSQEGYYGMNDYSNTREQGEDNSSSLEVMESEKRRAREQGQGGLENTTSTRKERVREAKESDGKGIDYPHDLYRGHRYDESSRQGSKKDTPTDGAVIKQKESKEWERFYWHSQTQKFGRSWTKTLATLYLIFGIPLTHALTDCEILKLRNPSIRDNCCDENGIACNADNRITRMYFSTYLTVRDFQNTALNLELSANIGNLTLLTHLNMEKTQLTGRIPAEIGNLTLLTYLNLGNNMMTGPIPNEIGKLVNLQTLNLGKNQLNGSIPAEIVSLTKLTYLSLNDNQLSGKLPIEISSLSSTVCEIYYGNTGLCRDPSMTGACFSSIPGISFVSFTSSLFA